ERENVFLGDASGHSRSGNLVQIDVVLLRDLADEGLERRRSPSAWLISVTFEGCCWPYPAGAVSVSVSSFAGGAGAAWAGRDGPLVLAALGAPAAFAGSGAAGLAGAAAAPAPSPSMTPTTVLTCTVVPSFIFTSLSTPLAGAGISASTLSVEISNRGSSR